jgi:hypothetical protein
MQTNKSRLDVRKKPKYLSYLSLPFGNGGTVTDVSAGGLGFEAIAPVKVDGPIPVRFSIDSAARIRAVGELAWLDETGKKGGLRFIELPEEVREQIRVWASQPAAGATSRGMAAERAKARARIDDVQVAEPETAAKVAPNGKVDLVSLEPPKRLLYNLDPPIYSAPFYELSMFPLELTYNTRTAGGAPVDAVADLLSAAKRRPIAAVGLILALEVLLSIGMFALVSSNLAGESVLDWSEKMLRGTHSQPGAQTFAPHLNSVIGSSKLARR